MTGLLHTQQAFLACVLDDTAPAPAGWTTRQMAGLTVYRNAYRARLLDTLRDMFERTARLAGDDAFQQAAAHHLILHPPAHWTIDLAGEGFAETCAALFAGDPDVGELAWLEWAMHRAFAAPDAAPLTLNELAQATAQFAPDQWETLRLSLLPGTSMRAITHDLVKLWSSLGAEERSPHVQALPSPLTVVVWREGERPVFVLVSEEEGRALAVLQQSGTFAEACAALSGSAADEAAADCVGETLRRWLELGLIGPLCDQKWAGQE